LLSVIYALDLSESVPEEERQEGFRFIQESLTEMGHTDRAGIVAFGKDAVLDVPAQPFLDWERPTSVYDDQGTNLASGLRLALAAFPVESQKRIVLLSDGNENRGSVLEEARRLAGLGVPVDVYPLEYRHEAEVYVEKIVHPNQVNEDEPLDLDLFVQSRTNTSARLRLFLEDQLIRDQPVELTEGKNKFTVHSLKLPSNALAKVEVRIEAEEDTSQENNRAAGFVNVVGRPLVLLVEGDFGADPSAAEEFVAQIQTEGIRVRRIAPGDLSPDPSEMLGTDVIILSNVNASDLSETQMETIERGVHDMGIGLVMIGGSQSFGAGGYRNTPIEEALPVRMDIKERKVIPSGALALVLHTCEIPLGNDWMRKIAIESIRVLDANDEVGMLDYEGMGVKWIFPIAPKGDGRRQIALIKGASPGDMPDFDSAMKLGFNGLVKSNSNLRHMVVISDGDPSPPSQGLLDSFVSQGITISTVLIGGHGMNFVGVMSGIANQTGGKFYDVKNPNSLPKIFSREAARVKRNLIVEETFQPRQIADTELTENFDPSAYPSLLGFVITTGKSGAEIPLLTHQEDPLLAHWRYGLGKSIAFASDFKRNWGPYWIEWNEFGSFWARAVRWVARKRMEGDYRVQVYREEGKGKVLLDAFDRDGKPLNYLQFEGRALSPSQETVPIRLTQTDLGRYEAEFDIEEEGTYLVNLFESEGEAKGEGGVLSAGLSVPYSPEYSNDRSNTNLLQRIAEITDGRYKPSTGAVFDHSLVAHAKPIPLWPWLLGTAIVLFWFDVFARRVLIDWLDVKRGAAIAYRYLLPERVEMKSGTLERLKEVKESGLAKPQPDTASLSPAPQGRFDFDALEKRKAEDVDLSKPEGRKAAPSKRETDPSKEDRAAEREGGRTTERLLDLKKRLKDK
jgi:uncharacterized membrane protein